MQAKKLLLCIALGFHLTSHAPGYPQSANQEAINLFNRATAETDGQKKIELYRKAVELDPTFVEALYNLGLAYKQLRDFRNAERYFTNAYQAKRREKSNKLKTRILYHLAVTQKRLKKLTQSENTLLDALQFAKDRDMRSKVTFELALVLYEQRKYDAALRELKAGQEKFKENRSYFQNLIKIVRVDIEADKLDVEIQKLLDAGEVMQAQALVQQLKTIKPNHAGLEKKLALIDSLMNSRAKREFLQEMYELAQKHARDGNLEMAISTYETLLQHDPNYEDARANLTEAREAFERLQTARQIEDEYAIGMTALQDKNWTRAIIAFEQVIELEPAYLEAESKLREAHRGLESENTENILRQYYFDGITAMNNKDLGTALASFEKIHKLDPNYKDTATLLEQIKRSYKPSTASALPSNEYFNSLYDQAVTMMKSEEWMQAVLVLEKLRLLAPEDHNILNLLIQARENLKLNSESADAAPVQKRYTALVYIGGAVVAMVVLPLFGFVIFSPTSRARIHYLRGSYLKAAKIYERLLARHPERLRYYPTLANIYLMLGRNDERALKVFKMIIDLNLARQIHPQIHAVLSQKYLGDGHIEDEAIAILENELRAEQEKQTKTEENSP
ncbi:MAG: tetratricopeptide repeat protein [bacterium]